MIELLTLSLRGTRWFITFKLPRSYKWRTNDIIPWAYVMLLSSMCVSRTTNTTQTRKYVWGCNSGCPGQHGRRTAWMNRGDTLVTTCRHEAGGIALMLTWSRGSSLLPSRITRLLFLCCRQSIRLWARFPEWIGVCNSAPGPRRGTGGIISCVTENRWLVFFSRVFIWMVNRLYYNYFYKTI